MALQRQQIKKWSPPFSIQYLRYRDILLTAFLLILPIKTNAFETVRQRTSVDEIKKHLLVVYNENAENARELAFTYATARQLDRSQIISIQCPDTEKISRDLFNQKIRTPIRQHMLDQGLLKLKKAQVNFNTTVKEVQVAAHNDIWSIVLIRGVPLKIEPAPLITPPTGLPKPFHNNAASVDSELSLITYHPIELSGPIPNPYYTDGTLRPFDAKMALSLILVARLDAPSVKDVRRMIHDAVATEKIELTGRAYFDARGITDHQSGYKLGDDWIRDAAMLTHIAGHEVFLDDKAPTFDSKLPVEDIALYAGWYTGHFNAPFQRKGFRFKAGSIAYHLPSFSANTIRNPNKNWVAPLLARGVTATMGSVYEPYLRFTPNIRTFFRSLLSGQCFGEAAYQSQSGLSWMITIVGDPLYRPYPRQTLASAQIAEAENSSEAPWLCLKVARLICQKSISRAEKIDRITRMVKALPHSITYEGLGNILTELKATPAEIAGAFRKAEELSTSSEGKIRNGLNLVQVYANQGKVSETMAEYERLLASYPEAAKQFAIPDLALAYASQNGWNQLSPELQTITPVDKKNTNTINPASNAPEAKTTTPNTTGIPVPPRRDLIPKRPSLSAPKVNGSGKIPAYHNPYKIPTAGS